MAHEIRVEGERWREERVKLLARRTGDLDGYTWPHSQRVAALAQRIGRDLGHPEELCDALRFAGLLHDVGKLAVPTALLVKPGELSRAERRAVQRHAVASERLARWLGHPDEVCQAVRHHHERWDGTGYPDGLSGEAVPVAARVLAIANTFDALTSDRCYRAAIAPAAALERIDAEAGRAFDPLWVEVILPLLERYTDGGLRSGAHHGRDADTAGESTARYDAVR